MDGSATVARETQTNGEFMHLERSTEELNKLLNVLENRISPILREHNDKPSDKDVPEPILVSLADRVRSIRKMNDQSIRKIGQMLERVEL